MKRLNGHTAIVTGGAHGIGQGIGLRLAGEGAAVGIIDISEDGKAEETVAQIEKCGGRGISVRTDVSDRDQVMRMAVEVKEALGPIDIVVNNAGVFDYDYRSAWTVDEEVWERIYRVNLKSVYLCCSAVLPDMVAAGWGRIINISSTSGISGGTSGIHYAASKGGVIALSKALASEVAAHGITVNVVAPSKIDTDLFRTAVEPQDRQKVVDKIPVGRIGRPEDVAEAVAYFAGEEAGYVTGQTLVVSGGY